MTTYAKATNVRVPYLTEGREYRVEREDVNFFYIFDDTGSELDCQWGRDVFADFQRIEKEEA